MVKRALLIILDSVGIGHAPDAGSFGDEGSATVGHIRETVPDFAIPTLDACGLRAAEALAAGAPAAGAPAAGAPAKEEPQPEAPRLSYGALTEVSAGKDTTTGHWEIAGAPVLEPFATFARFPPELVSEMEEASGRRFLGNYAQSGTVILEELGEEHLRSGHPILYTSADSVIQIAAHENVVPVAELYRICRACRTIADRERIGRVIARPFEGSPGEFRRTPRRHDFSIQPPETMLNRLANSGIRTTGVGKIHDIFAGSGIGESFPTKSNEDGCRTIDELLGTASAIPQLIFANLVDFDMLYGHRRDPDGYARALEAFDRWLETLLPRLDDDTLLVISADHGNDPTWTGTDHTRERVPLLCHDGGALRSLGVRSSYADIAASICEWFEVPADGLAGESFLTTGS